MFSCLHVYFSLFYARFFPECLVSSKRCVHIYRLRNKYIARSDFSIYHRLTIDLMAEKRPNIHPFFTTKRSKPTKSTESAESVAGSPTSINDTDEVNNEKVPNDCLDSSVVVIDDELEKDTSTSLIENQSEEHVSECGFVCCKSSTMYVPTSASEFQSTLDKDRRTCQPAWFTTYSWLTFCKVRYCKKKMSRFNNDF